MLTLGKLPYIGGPRGRPQKQLWFLGHHSTQRSPRYVLSKTSPRTSNMPHTRRLSRLLGSFSILQLIWGFLQVTQQADRPRRRTRLPPVIWRPRNLMRPLLPVPFRVHSHNHSSLGSINSTPIGACNGRNHFFGRRQVLLVPNLRMWLPLLGLPYANAGILMRILRPNGVLLFFYLFHFRR